MNEPLKFFADQEEIEQIITEYKAAFNEDPKYLYLPQPKNFEYRGMKVVIQTYDPDDSEPQYVYVSSVLPTKDYPEG